MRREIENQNGLDKPQFGQKSVRAHKTRSVSEVTSPAFFLGRSEFQPERSESFSCISFSLSAAVIAELNRLYAQGHDVNKILENLLKQRKQEIAEEKETIAKNVSITTSRYIPVKVKAILKEEFGQKCSIQTCQKPACAIHHSQRFALAHCHDPRYMAPLCKEHHQIAHAVDQRYWDKHCLSP